MFQKFFQKLAIWNSINDTNRSLLFQVSYKYGLTQHLLNIDFTHKTVELENCEFWAWMKKTMPCRRQGEKGRHVEEESKILPHFPKTPRQRCWIFCSLQSQFFWALSDFPESSFNRFPYVSQSSLQPNLCSKIVLPFKVPFVSEVKPGPTFSVAFLESTGFGTIQIRPAIPDSHPISWIALSRFYKRMWKVWALDTDSIVLNLGQITQPLHTSVSLTIKWKK